MRMNGWLSWQNEVSEICFLCALHASTVHQSRQKELLEQMRPVPLTLAGDGRCDSPGHTAPYGTYTLLETDYASAPTAAVLTRIRQRRRLSTAVQTRPARSAAYDEKLHSCASCGTAQNKVPGVQVGTGAGLCLPYSFMERPEIVTKNGPFQGHP